MLYSLFTRVNKDKYHFWFRY